MLNKTDKQDAIATPSDVSADQPSLETGECSNPVEEGSDYYDAFYKHNKDVPVSGEFPLNINLPDNRPIILLTPFYVEGSSPTYSGVKAFQAAGGEVALLSSDSLEGFGDVASWERTHLIANYGNQLRVEKRVVNVRAWTSFSNLRQLVAQNPLFGPIEENGCFVRIYHEGLDSLRRELKEKKRLLLKGLSREEAKQCEQSEAYLDLVKRKQDAHAAYLEFMRKAEEVLPPDYIMEGEKWRFEVYPRQKHYESKGLERLLEEHPHPSPFIVAVFDFCTNSHLMEYFGQKKDGLAFCYDSIITSLWRQDGIQFLPEEQLDSLFEQLVAKQKARTQAAGPAAAAPKQD